MVLRRVTAAALVVIGCTEPAADVDDEHGPSGKADDGAICEDPLYGDGTCHIDLGCGIPDIDCFLTFASDQDAADWARRQPYVGGRSALESTDPLFVRARSLVDRAWMIYADIFPLGKLADVTPAVVVLEQAAPGAFVMQEQSTLKVGHSVHFTTAILDPEISDDDLVGVIFHELAHITKLNIFPEVADKLQRFYVAPAGEEPIGNRQPTTCAHGMQ